MPFLDRAPDLPLPVPAVDAGSAATGPPGMLLQPGGPRSFADFDPPTPPVPPLAPHTAIAAPLTPAGPDIALGLDAERLIRLLGIRAGRPARWSAPAFGREVDLVRAHLRPIRSREMLAASLGREAFHGQATPGSDAALGGSAVRVAYALRWLELGDGVARPAWKALLEE